MWLLRHLNKFRIFHRPRKRSLIDLLGLEEAREGCVPLAEQITAARTTPHEIDLLANSGRNFKAFKSVLIQQRKIFRLDKDSNPGLQLYVLALLVTELPRRIIVPS